LFRPTRAPRRSKRSATEAFRRAENWRARAMYDSVTQPETWATHCYRAGNLLLAGSPDLLKGDGVLARSRAGETVLRSRSERLPSRMPLSYSGEKLGGFGTFQANTRRGLSDCVSVIL
jgi:hypothetical protein